MIDINIEEANAQLISKKPHEIIDFALRMSRNAVVTTNFRPFEGAILKAVSEIAPDISVIWCDSGYNTKETYLFADELINKYKLNLDTFLPIKSRAHRDATIGVPEIYDPAHDSFTKELKLEPFERAMNKYQPEIWFTNLRYGQTEHRNNLDILSFTKDGTLKVAPFFYFSDAMLQDYIDFHKIPDNTIYYDPTKGPEHRECGLHN